MFSRKKGDKAGKPSVINHGNVTPGVQPLGITCDHAEHVAVISFAALRRLGFGGGQRDRAGRALLAALGLVALAEQDARGYALRSRCDLVCDGRAPLELVRADGAVEHCDVDRATARRAYADAFSAARTAGFELYAEPIRLLPQDKLVEIVRRSQRLALEGEGGEPDEANEPRPRNRVPAGRSLCRPQPGQRSAGLAAAAGSRLFGPGSQLGRPRRTRRGAGCTRMARKAIGSSGPGGGRRAPQHCHRVCPAERPGDQKGGRSRRNADVSQPPTAAASGVSAGQPDPSPRLAGDAGGFRDARNVERNRGRYVVCRAFDKPGAMSFPHRYRAGGWQNTEAPGLSRPTCRTGAQLPLGAPAEPGRQRTGLSRRPYRGAGQRLLGSLDHVGACRGRDADLRAAALVAKALHKCILAGYERAGLGHAIPGAISGHTTERAPAAEPHLGFVPMAFVGPPFADGAVYGFAMVLPRDLDLTTDTQFQSALQAVAPWNDETARRELRLDADGIHLVFAFAGQSPRRSLDPGPYVETAAVWASCTPIVLDRHLKQTGNEARQLEIEALLGRACANIGLPAPERVIAAKHAALRGAPSAYPSGRSPAWAGWRLPPSLASRQLTHAVLQFPEPVQGPVILGAGRFVGLGLCRALDRPGVPA